METIYNSSVQLIEYDVEKTLFKMTWKPASGELTEEEFKAEMLEYLELLKKYKPLNTFWDMRKLEFIISPGVQEWIDSQAVAEAEIIKKQAILMPHDYIGSLSVQQTLEEEVASSIATKMSDNEQELINWLEQEATP